MKNLLFRSVAAAAMTVCASVCHAQAAHSLAGDAKAFGTREEIRSVSLSPDGSKAAMLVSGPGSTTILQVADLGTGSVTSLTSSDGKPQTLYACDFAGNKHLVCSFGSIESFDGSMVQFSRLMTIAVDGSSMKLLGEKGRGQDQYLRQYDGDIVDWLPGRDGQVLMARQYVREVGTTGSMLGRNRDGLGVDLVDLSTLKSNSVEYPRPKVDSYMSDGRGHIRIYKARDEASGFLTGRTIIKYRLANSNDWRDFGFYDERNDTGFIVLAIDADTDSAYTLKKDNGREALYRVKLDGSLAATRIAANASVDIDDVVRLGAGQRVIGYTYADERRHHIYFDSEFGKLQSALAKVVPSQPLVDLLGASDDGTKLLIYASGDIAPGTFYHFDKTTSRLGEVGRVRPLLEGRSLARVQTIRVIASDGAQIPAYLTIPPGTTGKNLPAVVLPHGGPSARDEWGFDWLAQFLAARGYAVIQPNYRGSAGYGDAWLAKNGFQGWRTSIGDVTASARYLVQQGIADPKRLAIVGWSYGGYAALQSVATEPDLYRAAVAIAPVTDLGMLKRQYESFTNSNLVKSFIGTGPHVIEGSPLRNVDKIKVPVLLIHADHDANVDISESEAMAGALKSAGKPVEFARFKGLTHQIDDSDARTTMLTKIGELLERTIGH